MKYSTILMLMTAAVRWIMGSVVEVVGISVI